MIAPNVLIDDAVERFARLVGLPDDDRVALEGNLASATGVDMAALRLDRLVGERASALLVIHDRDDREVPFAHGERLVDAWREGALHPTTGLGHRRILRDERVIADVVAFTGIGRPERVSDLVREVDRWLD